MAKASKVFNGGRAIVSIDGAQTGIFTSVSWSLVFDEQVIAILGNYGPVEIVYTGMQPVGIQASGWRVIDHGPHSEQIKLPTLDQLMLSNDVTFAIHDRATGKYLLKASQVKPTTVQQSVAIRQASELSANYIGITADDESGENVEGADAARLP